MELLDIYSVLVACHGVAGALGLVLALIPSLARKGGPLHRRAGWGFVVAMTFTAGTGVILAGMWLAVPLAVKPPSAPIDAEEAARLVANLRVFGVFLCYLAVLILSGVWHGVRILRAGKSDAHALGNRILDRGLPALLLAGGVALLYLSLARGSVLLGVFGTLGILSGYDDLRTARAPRARGRAAVARHLESMLGAVIGALTAFLVFGARSLPGGLLPESMYFVAWLAPAALGIPAIALLERRYGPGRRVAG